MLKWIWGNPLIEGFSNQPQKGYSEIVPDAGVPFRRLNFTDIYDICTCSFCLTREEYVQFISWYKFDIRQGSIPFEMYDCRYGLERVARLVGDVPQFPTNSKFFNLNVTIAFEPSVINQERTLTVDERIPLLVNNNLKLIVNFELRL